MRKYLLVCDDCEEKTSQIEEKSNDSKVSDMQEYLSKYGWHFSPKAVEYATSKMITKEGPLVPITLDKYKSMLTKHNVKIDTKYSYDALYIANMALADFYGSSLKDELHLILFVKDYLEDPDGNDELPFKRWHCSELSDGKTIDWSHLL